MHLLARRWSFVNAQITCMGEALAIGDKITHTVDIEKALGLTKKEFTASSPTAKSQP